MRVVDIMTRRVVSVRPETTIDEAARLMLQDDISGLVVLDHDGTLAGIVTEGDLLRRAETGTERRRPRWLSFITSSGRLADEYVKSHGRRVGEIMTRDVVTVGVDTPLADVVDVMERRRIKRVPVLADGKVVGIVSRANLLQALAHLATSAPATKPADVALRRRVLDEIEKQGWAPRTGINVIVHDGVVELWGVILDAREGEALRVLAENVPGVAAVRDHLVWVEPMSGMVIEDRAPAD